MDGQTGTLVELKFRIDVLRHFYDMMPSVLPAVLGIHGMTDFYKGHYEASFVFGDGRRLIVGEQKDGAPGEQTVMMDSLSFSNQPPDYLPGNDDNFDFMTLEFWSKPLEIHINKTCTTDDGQSPVSSRFTWHQKFRFDGPDDVCECLHVTFPHPTGDMEYKWSLRDEMMGEPWETIKQAAAASDNGECVVADLSSQYIQQDHSHDRYPETFVSMKLMHARIAVKPCTDADEYGDSGTWFIYFNESNSGSFDETQKCHFRMMVVTTALHVLMFIVQVNEQCWETLRWPLASGSTDEEGPSMVLSPDVAPAA